MTSERFDSEPIFQKEVPRQPVPIKELDVATREKDKGEMFRIKFVLGHYPGITTQSPDKQKQSNFLV